jgi:hypothetical protein
MDNISAIDTLVSNIKGSDATSILLAMFVFLIIKMPKSNIDKRTIDLVVKGLFIAMYASIGTSFTLHIIDLIFA